MKADSFVLKEVTSAYVDLEDRFVVSLIVGYACSDCRAWADHYRRAWNAATTAERDPARYRRDMRDAGRARLLRSEER